MPTKAKDPKQKAISEHQAELVTKEQEVESRLVAIEEAETHLEDLRSRLAAGDDSVSTEALVAAQTGIERAQILHEGAVTAVKQLKANAPFWPLIADTIAGPLADELAVPVKVVDSFPTEPGKELPVMYLVQQNAAVPDRHPQPFGSMTGQVRARFYRPKYMRTAITAKDIESALPPERVQGKYRVPQVATNGQVDTFTVIGRGVWPEVPKVPANLGDHTIRSFGDSLAWKVREDTKDPERAVLATSTGYDTVDVYGIGSKVIDSSVTANSTTGGIRRLTLRVRFDAWVNSGFEHRIPQSAVEKTVEDVVERWGTLAHEFLGRARSATLTRELMKVDEILMQTSAGGFVKRDRGTVKIYVATFTFEAAV